MAGKLPSVINFISMHCKYVVFFKRRSMSHIERKTELKRKRKRRATVAKLKEKLAKTKNPGDQQAIVTKIKRVSPFWQPMK